MPLFIYAALALARYGLAQVAGDDRGYMISYNGSMRGSYVSGKSAMKTCGSGGAYYFSGLGDISPELSDSVFKIGPPGDGEINPFFFRLDHAGGTGFGTTIDAVYNLQLISSWYYYYDEPPVDFVIMNKSTLRVVNSGPGLGGKKAELPYYSVVGGIESLHQVASNSAWEGFNFQIPRNYSDDELQEGSKCQSLVEGTIDFRTVKNMTYSLKFTNSSAEVKFSATTNESTVITVYFSGARIDLLHGTEWDFEENSTAPIALANPRDHVTPNFTFANGSAIPPEFSDAPNTPNTTLNHTSEDVASGNPISYSWLTVLLVFSLVIVLF